MSDYPHLFSPLEIGPMQVRNRVLVSAHVPGFAENNKPGKQYIAYHQNYARNGVGLQITGGTPVHESGLLSTSSDGLWNLDDSIIPGYQALSAAVHQEGGRILAQLAHSGGTVLIGQPGRESWSASAVRSEINGNISHEMSQREIIEVIDAHALAAKRVVAGGMDGVEVLSAFGFLPQAFLSPLTNHRQDQYGGSLNNRMRFLLELLESVRGVLGTKCVLGIRLPGDEFEPGGLALSDMQVICKQLADTNLIDYLNIIAHTNFSHQGRNKHWAPTPVPHGVFVPLAAAIRKVVNLPVFAVGRIVDPSHAEDVLARGQADMVGMTRAHICDPEILQKLRGKVQSSIRICAGANICIANRYAGKPIRCIQNALLPTPGRKFKPTPEVKSVVVIGAGPAGLECARISAERGHHVTVYEASSRAGGQLALWANAPSMNELRRVIDWRLDELARLNVLVHFDSLMTRTDILKLEVDAVVIATGAFEQHRTFDGDSKIKIITPHDVLGGAFVQESNVLVLNDGRGQAGVAAAEALLHQKKTVEIVSSDIAVASDIDATNRSAWFERLGKLNCSFTNSNIIKSINHNQVTLCNVFDSRSEIREAIDLIVDWSGSKANDQLVTAFDYSNIEVFSVGDCRAPRTVEIAISEAMAIAEKI